MDTQTIDLCQRCSQSCANSLVRKFEDNVRFAFNEIGSGLFYAHTHISNSKAYCAWRTLSVKQSHMGECAPVCVYGHKCV